MIRSKSNFYYSYKPGNYLSNRRANQIDLISNQWGFSTECINYKKLSKQNKQFCILTFVITQNKVWIAVDLLMLNYSWRNYFKNKSYTTLSYKKQENLVVLVKCYDTAWTLFLFRNLGLSTTFANIFFYQFQT